MRNNALRLMQGLRAAGALREAARTSMGTSMSAARFLSVLSSSAVTVPAQFGRQPAQFAPALSLALGEALSRALHGSSSTGAEALTEVAVEGDADGVLSELDKLVSSEGVSAKEVADAAVALTYLQVKGNRRIWGKVVEKAGALKASFDAASLTSLLWALTTAGVEHFKTVAELAGTAAALAKSLTPAQLSVVVEALGRAGVNDAELHGKISDAVTSKVGDFKPAELARILYGYAAAGVTDAKLAKAVGAALAAKAGELGSREAAQGLWALATLGRLDKPVVDALTKALKSKLSGAESAADAAAGAWALGQLGVKDPATGKALGDALKAGVADLSATQAVQAALGLGLLGGADAAAVGALLSAAAAAVDKAPTAALEPAVLAQLHAAAALTPEAKLPAGVAAYAEKAFGLTVDAARIARPGYASCFVEDVADAVALATGARYRPEVAAAKKGFARPAPDGSLVEIVVDADASTKLAILPIDASHLTTTAPPTLLGSALALARVREAQGYKVVPISAAGWEGDAKAKAGLVLQAIRRAVPALSAKVDTYAKKLAEPFDPYA